jgi:uncharacterized membrane protein YvbJ
MFCSSCGSAITPELNYCKRCGAELNDAGKQSGTDNKSLILGFVAVPVFSITAIIGLVVLMKDVIGFDTKLVGVIAVMSFFLFVIADIALVLALLNRSRTNKKPAKKAQLNEAVTQSLYQSPARELAEPMPMSSVTEHTTRSLDAIPRKAKKQ